MDSAKVSVLWSAPPTTPGTDTSRRAALRLAVMMAVAGTLHFVTPTFFDRIIPPVLPGSARSYTRASGLAAYATAATLTLPQTQRLGGTLAALFFVAVMPAKVQLTINWFRDENTTSALKVAAIVQLPWQIPLITEALKARRNAPRASL
ncbi:DoxX family protein [Parasphingorhabdus pacifica]